MQSLVLKPIPRRPGDHLARPHVELTRAAHHRGPVVVDVADEAAAGVADDLGPLPLDAPVVEGLEEGPDLVLLLEPELGGVDGGEGDGVLVPGLEVEVRRIEVVGTEVEVGPALLARVDRRH